MLNFLKNHFIPHEGNKFRPYFLHGENARTIILLILLLELFVFVFPMKTFVDALNSVNLADVSSSLSVSYSNQQQIEKNSMISGLVNDFIESPYHYLNVILLLILALVIIALILNIVIRFDIKHPDLITNGLAVIAFIGVAFLINSASENKELLISEENYSIQQIEFGLKKDYISD
jgi:hypothetical protein